MKIVRRKKNFIVIDKETGYVHDGEFGDPKSALSYIAQCDDKVDTKSLWKFESMMWRGDYERVMEGNVEAMCRHYRI